MLILTRKTGEKLRIGDDIEIIVVDISRTQVRLAIKAPRSIEVHREEIYDRIQKAKNDGKSSRSIDYANNEPVNFAD